MLGWNLSRFRLVYEYIKEVEEVDGYYCVWGNVWWWVVDGKNVFMNNYKC